MNDLTELRSYFFTSGCYKSYVSHEGAMDSTEHNLDE